MEYEESRRLLIEDLRSIPDTGKVRMYWGGESFTIPQLLKEIEDETEVGKEHIEMHIGAHNLIEELKANPPKKRCWCKFWK